MRRIAFIVCNISSVGGTERAVINIANTLSKNKDIIITIISMFSSSNDNPGLIISDKVAISHLGLDIRASRRLRSYCHFIRLMYSVDKRKEYDIVIGTTHAMNSLIAVCMRNIKRVACEHTIYEACPLGSRIVRRIVYPKLDALVLLTKSEFAKYTFINDKRKYVIPNALSFNVENPASLNNHVIITAGRLTSVKRYDLLIDLALYIKKELVDWEIRIFGDGECRNDLQNQINSLQLQNYVLLKGNSNNILKELLDSSILVMTSQYEGLPMILIEGQACGLPIVSFDCPEGPRNIVDNGSDGYLIQEGKKEEFVKKVVELAKDIDRRKSFGENAYKASKKYDCDQVAIQWMTFFDEIDMLPEV